MKLSKEQVAKVKERIREGRLTQPEIAKEFEVSRSLISDIATGRAHKVKGEPLSPKKPGGQHKQAPDYDPTDKRVLALEAEVAHLCDERTFLKRQIKAATKTHGLFQAIVEELPNVVKPMKPLPVALPLQPSAKRAQIEEHLVMHISDGHHDQIVKPIECGNLERHNFLISMRRAEQYVDTVLKWTQETLAPNFTFPVLTILSYGDHTSGEIHGHVERSYFRNIFKNCFAIGQLHALMIRDLAPYFQQINVLCVPGNHGRRSMKKDYHGAHNNWDYLVAEVAKLHCADMPNVTFAIPDTFTVNVEINGVGFCVFHGDDIKSNLGIPFYGLERRQRRIMALNALQGGPRVRYYVCGHFHRPAGLVELDGEMIVNGSWVATDAYAYNSFSGFTEPSQLLHGVNPKHGITWRMPIHLRTEHEERGPRRYKIAGAEEVLV